MMEAHQIPAAVDAASQQIVAAVRAASPLSQNPTDPDAVTTTTTAATEQPPAPVHHGSLTPEPDSQDVLSAVCVAAAAAAADPSTTADADSVPASADALALAAASTFLDSTGRDETAPDVDDATTAYAPTMELSTVAAAVREASLPVAASPKASRASPSVGKKNSAPACSHSPTPQRRVGNAAAGSGRTPMRSATPRTRTPVPVASCAAVSAPSSPAVMMAA